MRIGRLWSSLASTVRSALPGLSRSPLGGRNDEADDLTGLGSASAFEAGYDASCVDVTELSLLLIDLDLLSAVNQRMGTKSGDQVLRAFADCAEGVVGPDFTLFRLGGDEFCCLLAGTSEEVASSVGEAVRMRFAAMSTLTHAGLVRATVSIGVASSRDVGFGIDGLLAAASLALAEAKRSGRDRVVCHGALPAGQGQSANPGVGAFLPSSRELIAALR